MYKLSYVLLQVDLESKFRGSSKGAFVDGSMVLLCGEVVIDHMLSFRRDACGVGRKEGRGTCLSTRISQLNTPVKDIAFSLIPSM